MAQEAQTEDFFAHYGVKGMRWGQRNATDSGGNSGGGKAERTPEEQARISARNKKIVKGAAIGVAVVGAGVAAYMLKKHGNERMSNLAQAAKNAAINKAKESAKDRITNKVIGKTQERVGPKEVSATDLRFQAGINAQQRMAASAMANREVNRFTGPSEAERNKITLDAQQRYVNNTYATKNADMNIAIAMARIQQLQDQR